MTSGKRLELRTFIRAPIEVVWQTMLGADSYPRWTKAFAEGSYFEGEWSRGSRIKFLTPSGEGMVAEIADITPPAFVSIRHLGFVANGIEDTESDSVRAWAPAYENYTLSSVEGGTQILVHQDVTAEFEEFMKDTWPKAFELLKQLCEDESPT